MMYGETYALFVTAGINKLEDFFRSFFEAC